MHGEDGNMREFGARHGEKTDSLILISESQNKDSIFKLCFKYISLYLLIISVHVEHRFLEETVKITL